ncbi:type II toxin-antitoxin system Phd/YefM family antitoxin [Burkholderia ubonensis]|uniref:type II toxin-antitoxin system Phd/YefM family antitoxin n=1 Tax=Burkholderia ubonensis TaxID=101571 RepID=UPI00075A4377|nr:type II toxin-antitoxin system prevent-host-death family antitoxin [Burkholderia ubonensis]AOI72212.1 prevent-host-death protein [Burkholderia ubonensis]KUZ20092.1 prevent-host-death protein [Burkholderia ubonensis]KUZ36551.1 prevent-host-death protein [Burkholderia ubonensis]KUZ40124.1 prevent-host-death protein [Burkholderia ubonensis]KUZ42970.1 prevent-host-death protein [Burkholderia ubonensis]
MQNANLHDAALDLSRLVDTAIAGEDVVISQDGKPSVRLVPLKPIHQYGLLKGQIGIADDFDAPLPDDLLDAFEGK